MNAISYAFVAENIQAGPCELHRTRTRVEWESDEYVTLAFWQVGETIDAKPGLVRTFKKSDVIFTDDEALAVEIGMKIGMALTARRMAIDAAYKKFESEIGAIRKKAAS
jgi:hypothetical protein